MSNFCENPNLIVEIYKHISPVFIWIENIKKTLKENDTFKQEDFFQLLKEIRNEASHLNIYQNEKNEMLFIKIVMIYKRLGLNLIEESPIINRIWNRLHNDYEKQIRINKLKFQLENIDLEFYGKYENNLNLFTSFLFSILQPTENNRNQYEMDLINLIFQYICPIIIWDQQMKGSNETDWKFLDLLKEIKNRVCHLSNKNYENLEEILKSIFVVYKLVGIDLKNHDLNMKEIDFDPIQLCIEYKENEIKEEMNEIVQNVRNNTRRKSYEFFRKIIDLFVLNENGSVVIDQINSDQTTNESEFLRNFENPKFSSVNDTNEKGIDGLKISTTKLILDIIKDFIFCWKFN